MRKQIENPVANFFAKSGVPVVNTPIGMKLLCEFIAQLKHTVPGVSDDQILIYLRPLNDASSQPFSRVELAQILDTPSAPARKPSKRPGPEAFAENLFES